MKEQTQYSLGLDIDNQEHKTKELQKILLKILMEFDRIARKNNIPYALCYGSALGIVNYQGFVPWDDDIDIAIDYFDINRLIEALKKDLSEEFYFDCYEDDKDYNVLIPTFKIRIRNTYIKEVNDWSLPNRCKKGNGVFIDIVALMGVPKCRHEHIKLIRYSKLRSIRYIFLDAFLHREPKKLKEQLKAHEEKCANKYKDSEYISQTIIIPYQRMGKENISYPKDVLYPLKEYEFEGHKFYSFNDVNKYIELTYGKNSFMKEVNGELVDPYPLKKRKKKHIKQYSLNREIK